MDKMYDKDNDGTKVDTNNENCNEDKEESLEVNMDIDDNITMMRNFTVDEFREAKSLLDEEEVTVVKHNKGNKKVLFIILGCILLLIVVVSCYFIFFSNNSDGNRDDVNNNKDDVVNDDSNKDDNSLVVDDDKDAEDEDTYIDIYKDKKNKYVFDDTSESIYRVKCSNKDDCKGLYVDSKYVIIRDGKNGYILDYKSKKKVLDKVDISDASLIIGYNLSSDKGSDFGFLLRSSSDKYGVYNLNEASLVIPMDYDKIESIPSYLEEGVDSVSAYSSLLVLYKNSKYGIVNASKYKMVVPIEKESLYRKYFDGKMYLFGVNNGKTVGYSVDGKKLLDGLTFTDMYAYSLLDGGYGIILSGNDVSFVKYDNTTLGKFVTLGNGDVVTDSVLDVSKKEVYVVVKSSSECVKYSYDFDTKEIVNDTLDECN